METITAFFIGMFFSWLGLNLGGWIGWLLGLITALLVITLYFVSCLARKENQRKAK